MRNETASRAMVAGIGALLASAGHAVPNAFNIHDFANRLVNQRCRLVVVSDSIWSEDAEGRMPVGVRDRWNIDFAGWTVMSNSTATDALGMVMQAASTPDDLPSPPGAGYGREVVGNIPPTVPPYNFFLPGSLTVSPKRYMESHFRGDWTRSAPFWRGALQAGNPNSSGVDRFSLFRRGSWLKPSLAATGIFFNHGSCLNHFALIPYRNGAQTFGGAAIFPTMPGVQGATVNCFGVGEPWLQFQDDGVVQQAYNPQTTVANSNLVILGAHFEDQTAVRGCSFTTIANAGWSAADHADLGFCSNQNLGGYLAAVGRPDLVLIQLGANAEANEIDAAGQLLPQWKANVEAVIARYRFLLTPSDADGHTAPPPLFLLVSQYDLGLNYPRVPMMPQALYEIAQANADVGFINLNAFAGSYASLLAGNYISDGVHPSAAGSDLFADHIWIPLSNAVCPGDANGDRVVDFLDLNIILSQFGVTADGQHGDVNNDGVVDFLDLNVILSSFGTSCEPPA